MTISLLWWQTDYILCSLPIRQSEGWMMPASLFWTPYASTWTLHNHTHRFHSLSSGFNTGDSHILCNRPLELEVNPTQILWIKYFFHWIDHNMSWSMVLHPETQESPGAVFYPSVYFLSTQTTSPATTTWTSNC